MNNENTPTEGQNSDKLPTESALRDAACCPSFISRATAISGDRTKSVLCMVEGQDVESVAHTVKQLFEIGLSNEYFQKSLKIVIDIAPIDQPALMHDTGALFESLHSGQLEYCLGCIIREDGENSIGKGGAANQMASIEKSFLTEDVAGGSHILDND